MEIYLNAYFQNLPKMEKIGNPHPRKTFKKHLTNTYQYDIIDNVKRG